MISNNWLLHIYGQNYTSIFHGKVARMTQPCPLCASDNTKPYHCDTAREYVECNLCQLIFVPTDQHLSHEDEKSQYDHHQNDPLDDGYRTFLSRLHEPMQARLAPHSMGLDFGSGPGPTLSQMFEEAGHTINLFDIYYANDASIFDEAYDFITASEVVEHLSNPAEVLEKLWRCLKSGGLLGIMTKRVTSKDAFKSWHYKNDPTHICFFSEHAFKWLGNKWGTEPEFVSADVVLFKKP